MITDHTVIHSVTAISISTAIQLNQLSGQNNRLYMGFSMRQNRFHKTSAFGSACVTREISSRSNDSSQVFRNHMSKDSCA